MADIDDDVLELTDDLQADEAGNEDQDQRADEAADGGEPDAGEDVISFGDEESPSSGEADNSTIRHMRQTIADLKKERDDLRNKVPQAQQIEVGEKPTLAGCEFDEAAFETALDEWKERKSKAEAQQNEAAETARKANEVWANEVQAYHTQKAALGYDDVQEMEETALSSLSDIQQRVIVRSADNAGRLMYALGKHPAKLSELSKITDPIKLAVAVAKLEGKMTVAKRGGPPAPERIARGDAPAAASADKKLAELEKEAQRTGNFDKVFQYKRALKSKA